MAIVESGQLHYQLRFLDLFLYGEMYCSPKKYPLQAVFLLQGLM